MSDESDLQFDLKYKELKLPSDGIITAPICDECPECERQKWEDNPPDPKRIKYIGWSFAPRYHSFDSTMNVFCLVAECQNCFTRFATHYDRKAAAMWLGVILHDRKKR